MNVRFLESFVWAARLHSFKAAADRLHTTQAGISSRIATLEEQFGVRLFEREHRTVSLTHHGRQLLPHAERMLDLQSRMMSAMGQGEAHTGVLRIGVIETVVHTWLPELLFRFGRLYPRVTLELKSDNTPALREDLMRGTLDCVVTAEEITPGFIENRRLAKLAMGWVAHPDLAAQLPQDTIGFDDLAPHPIISFHRESPVYRNIAESVSDRADLRINFFSSIAAMIDLARAAFGITVVPLAIVDEDLRSGRLVRLPVLPHPAPLPLVASQRLERSTPLAEAWVTLAQSVCDDHFAGDRQRLVTA